MKTWQTARLFGSSLPAMAHRHGVATAGAMLTCVAVALNVPPFTSPKKMDAFDAETTRSVTQESHESIATLPEVVTVPQLQQSGTEVAENSVTALIESPVAAEIPVPASKPPQPNTDGDESAATFVGVWAPDAGTCSAREFREGVLPAVISTDGAWAGETFCMFTSKKQTETGWNVTAKCSNPRERWTTSVRLTVKDNRLTWTSKRGAQTYTRCAPDVLMAAVR
jgi:hypothetical protein